MSRIATSEQLARFVGQTGNINLGGLNVQVKIRDARIRFGHIDLLLAPVAGTGDRWVEAQRVDLGTPTA